MSYITAYTALCEPVMGRLPVKECFESIYDHVDEIVVYDCSKYDNLDLSMYGKVKKHVRGIWNPFDNPFGSMFTQALKLVQSDTAMFIDADEIFNWKTTGLRDLVKRYPMQDGVGIAFRLVNFYCSRNFVVDGCSSKGAHVFRMDSSLAHDSLNGYWQHRSRIRRTNNEPDGADGVRLCNEQCMPMMHYQPVSLDEVEILHTSHLDLAGKMVRSILQYNHTSTLDLLDFFPFDMRLRPELVEKIYSLMRDEIASGDVKLYGLPEKIEYEGNKFLDAFVERIELPEFDPTKVKDYENWKDIGETNGDETEESGEQRAETVVVEPDVYQNFQPMPS